MDKETLRMQMLSGIITESEYKIKISELDPSTSPGESGKADWEDAREKESMYRSYAQSIIPIKSNPKYDIRKAFEEFYENAFGDPFSDYEEQNENKGSLNEEYSTTDTAYAKGGSEKEYQAIDHILEMNHLLEILINKYKQYGEVGELDRYLSELNYWFEGLKNSK